MFKIAALVDKLLDVKQDVVDIAKKVFKPRISIGKAVQIAQARIDRSPFAGILLVDYIPEQAWFPAEVKLVYTCSDYRFQNKVKAYPIILDEICALVDDIIDAINEDRETIDQTWSPLWRMEIER